jgi:hypothetical protein
MNQNPLPQNPLPQNPFQSPAMHAAMPVAELVEPKYSGLGIASFVMSLLIGIGLFAMFVVAGVMEATTPGGIPENSGVAVVVGLMIIGLVMLDVVALLLGVAGLCQANRRKLFAALGLVFSLAIALGTVGLIAIGMAMS